MHGTQGNSKLLRNFCAVHTVDFVHHQDFAFVGVEFVQQFIQFSAGFFSCPSLFGTRSFA